MIGGEDLIEQVRSDRELMLGSSRNLELPLRPGGDLVDFHQTGYTVEAACNTLRAQFSRHPWTAVNSAISLVNDLYLLYQRLGFFFATTDRSLDTGVVCAPRNLKYFSHLLDAEAVRMIRYKLSFGSGFLEKMANAFFKMSRCSVTSRNCFFSFRNSSSAGFR